MKKTFLLAVLSIAALCLRAQTNPTIVTPFGVGTVTPQTSLHIHETTEYDPAVPLDPNFGNRDGDSTYDRTRDEHYFDHNYMAEILMTTPNTTAGGGFSITHNNYDATISLQESGTLRLLNNNHAVYLTDDGKFGVGGISNLYAFYVQGTAGFRNAVTMQQGLTVGGTLSATALQGPLTGLTVDNMVFFHDYVMMSQSLRVNGTATMHGVFNVDGPATLNHSLKVGNGFFCDASGNLKVKHLKVTLTDWADYVFAPGYRLRPLGEVETYIGKHGHLPGVPSAEEVERDGADLGEMNKVLMEKVEELTLYIIDLQKQIDELKSNK